MAEHKRMGRPPKYSTDDLTTVKVPRYLAERIKAIIEKLDSGKTVFEEVPEVDCTKSQSLQIAR